MRSAVTAVLEIGHSMRYGGRVGSITGVLFSHLALTALARMMLLRKEINKSPGFASSHSWLPVVASVLAAGTLLFVVRKTAANGPSTKT